MQKQVFSYNPKKEPHKTSETKERQGKAQATNPPKKKVKRPWPKPSKNGWKKPRKKQKREGLGEAGPFGTPPHPKPKTKPQSINKKPNPTSSQNPATQFPNTFLTNWSAQKLAKKRGTKNTCLKPRISSATYRRTTWERIKRRQSQPNYFRAILEIKLFSLLKLIEHFSELPLSTEDTSNAIGGSNQTLNYLKYFQKSFST